MQRSEHQKSRVQETARFLLMGCVGLVCSICMVLPHGNAQIPYSETGRLKPTLVVQTGHIEAIRTLAISPDGKTIASGGIDKTVRLWNADSGKQIRTLKGHMSWVFSVAFSPDGRMVASAGGPDGTVRIWDITTGRQLKLFQRNEQRSSDVETVVFSPDGKLIAAGNDDATITIWNIATDELVATLRGHSYLIKSIAFSNDGAKLVSGGTDSIVRVSDIRTGQVEHIFRGHVDRVNQVLFSPAGKILASASRDKTVKLWDLETGFLVAEVTGHTASVNSVSFSADAKTLISGSDDKTIRLWNTETGEPLRLFSGHDSNVRAIALSGDGRILASTDWQTIKLWNVTTGQLSRSFSSHRAQRVTSIAVSSDGKRIATGGWDNAVRLWNVQARQPLTMRQTHTKPVQSVSFSPDGSTLASGSSDRSVKLWDIETGRLAISLEGHTESVNAVAFSVNGRMVASSANKIIKLWNIKTGNLVHSIETKGESMDSLAFTPDGKTLASGGWQSIKLWDVETGQLITSLDERKNSLKPIAFSPDGRLLASGTGQNEIRIWSATFGTLIRSLLGHPYYDVESIQFSPDGLSLVTGGSDDTIRIWDPYTGEQRLVLSGHEDWVNGIAFFPSGNVFASGSADGTVKIWRIGGNEPLLTLVALDDYDWIVATPEGRFDTNKSLDSIEGMHWVVPDDPMKPVPLDVFMRQYYEPGLLARLLKCNAENTCSKEFKPLPSIAELNRVQSKVEIKPPKPVAGSSDVVDVTVVVESSTETKSGSKSSGVYDLRLFRDGQLVGTSTPKDRTEKYIAEAPKNVSAARPTDGVMDSPEDRAWRVANDIFTIKSDTVKIISPARAEVTFRNVKLPRDGRKEVEFTAYAFNTDRVKSDTARATYKIEKPRTRPGRAYLISIGVNTSENKTFNLRYAANDARKMQEIVGERLNTDGKQYSEVVSVPLISDDKSGKYAEVNHAKKSIIKGVFSLLAGNPREVPDAIRAQIPNADKVKPVEPEDTLIITYAGHGYADRSGIFYLVPNDIGADTFRITSENAVRMISSDELSLWMQDITAAEMIMVIDACHSSSAVQGEGFKPAPMGSRGLGQLAYDKGMRILSATQSNNVALELGSLQQGLLSYALLEDGVVKKKADTGPSDGKLTAAEWLGYAEKAVPKLYQDVLDGKRSILVAGVPTDTSKLTAQARADKFCENCDPKKIVQEPSIFDFRKNKTERILIDLK